MIQPIRDQNFLSQPIRILPEVWDSTGHRDASSSQDYDVTAPPNQNNQSESSNNLCRPIRDHHKFVSTNQKRALPDQVHAVLQSVDVLQLLSPGWFRQQVEQDLPHGHWVQTLRYLTAWIVNQSDLSITLCQPIKMKYYSPVGNILTSIPLGSSPRLMAA